MLRSLIVVAVCFLIYGCATKSAEVASSEDSLAYPDYDTTATVDESDSSTAPTYVSAENNLLAATKDSSILSSSVMKHDIITFDAVKKDSLYTSIIQNNPGHEDSSTWQVGLDTYHKDRKSGRVLRKKIQQGLPVGTPRKLNYIQWNSSPYAGNPFPIKIQLNDADNLPIRGTKDFKVNISVTGVNVTYQMSDSVKIVSGESVGDFLLNLKTPGIYKIACSNDEMLPAEWYIQVLPISKKKVYYTPTQRVDKPVFKLVAYQNNQASIIVLLQTEKRVLADGIDQATMTFFLSDPTNVITDTDSVRILLSCSEAKLQSKTIYVSETGIPKTVYITATQPGSIPIQILCTRNNISISRDWSAVKFYPAIYSYEIKPNPNKISLLERSNIIVLLKNKEGRTIETLEDVQATLFVDPISGSGILEPEYAKIAGGQTEGSVVLLPVAPGEIKLSGSVKSLPSQPPVSLMIIWPVPATLYSCGGGILGALLSHLKTRKKKVWAALLIGMIMGFVLFWFAVFLGIASLAHAVVMNPLSIIILGIVGGWLGTDVMKLLLDKFNFKI